MSGKKTVIAALIAASVLMAIIIIMSSFYFYHIGVNRKTEALYNQNLKLAQGFLQNTQEMDYSSSQTFSVMAVAEPFGLDLTENSSVWIENQFYETWTIISEDLLNLVGYYLPAKLPTNKTVIMAHGYGGRGMEMNQIARFYSE